MINIVKLKSILAEYKAYFSVRWKNEKYKWKAVKHFQDNWDIEAENFCEMFQASIDKTFNLMTSESADPIGMIINFADADDSVVRQMFRDLFDESRDLMTRVESFQTASETIRAKYDDGTWRNHYQNTNVISTYLWLMYPDKYYIYKYEFLRDVVVELVHEYNTNLKNSFDNLIECFNLYDEINKIICDDDEFVSMLRDAIDDTCYPDPKLKTATIDVCFYLSRFFLEERKAAQDDIDWFPLDYNPNISVAKWVELLNDPLVFTPGALQIMKRMKDYGGQATCKQLSIKYGGSINFYNAGSSALARRIAKKTGCAVMTKDTDNAKWWPILYKGKYAESSKGNGIYVWRLRRELSKALDIVDLSEVLLYDNEPPTMLHEERGYWLLTVNPKKWSFTDVKIGEEQSYTLYNGNGIKRRVVQNFLEVKTGDIVIGYEATPVKKIVAIAKITRPNDGDNIYFSKTEGLTDPIDYSVLIEYPDLGKMEFFVQPNGCLFKLTKEEFELIMDIIRDENPIKPATVSKYTKADFLSKVFMSEERYEILKTLLHHKKNIILQGAPGVGKTFAAKKLAYAMMGEVDDSRIEFVQFHQNYSYEDFIMGYRPDGSGFKLMNGVFYRFCQTAANNPDKEYFFIIDEINRGNMSKIFGELMMLIEKDYRGTKATLAYSSMPFFVPENLYIIGMMNTADRSLAMIDYALRRRFSFFEMEPGFDSEGFRNYQNAFANEIFNALIVQIIALNKEIEEDSTLGRGFRIGHSYFCGREKLGCTVDWMRSIVMFDIIPMLSEYWFDEPAKLQRWERNLYDVFDHE